MAITYNRFFDFTEQLVRGVHDWDAHVFKIALTNIAPTSSQISYNQTNHPAPVSTNGYPTGGITISVSVAEVNGVTTIQSTPIMFTATGGPLGPFRYLILYNDSTTSPADALIAWWDYGALLLLSATETFSIQFNSSSPGTILTLN